VRAFLFSLPILACSSSHATAEAPADAGPPTVTSEACATRCAAKAETCGAPAAQAGTTCASMCTSAITETQAACLEAKTCAELIAAASQGGTVSTICPGPEPVPGAAPGPTSVPDALTVATGIPANYVVDHTNAGAMRSSLFNVAGPPLLVPAPTDGHLPSVAEGRDVTVLSPPRNGCESVINVTLSATQLAVSTSGVDLVPDTKCADFIDAIAAEGLTLKLRHVPWKGSTETSTVTVALRRL
jgi:hypothetical protein